MRVMKTLEQLECDFESYQSARLERCKRIGVPNLALEMAERQLQQIMFMERDEAGTRPWDADLAGLLDALVALGESRFSTAHENRRDLFETSEEWIGRLRSYILDNWKVSK